MPPPTKGAPPKQTPQQRAQAREERQRQEDAKHELVRLQAARRSVVDALKGVATTHKQLVASLRHVETENERWQTPNANLGEMYRLKDEIEQAEKQVKECHRRWDQLAVEIEEKHDEIAFGGVDGSGGG